jgi:hypothetical protein
MIGIELMDIATARAAIARDRARLGARGRDFANLYSSTIHT